MSDKVLWVDSREQWTQARSTDTHIKDYFDKHSVPYIVKKLDVGDYTYEDSNIAVDRKQNLSEVAKNLTNRSDSSRFWREVRRAYEQHIQLVVLVESGPAVLSIKDVPKWKSKFSPVSGRMVQNEMIRLEQAYKVRWCFCSKRSTAKRIIEILEGEGLNKSAQIRTGGMSSKCQSTSHSTRCRNRSVLPASKTVRTERPDADLPVCRGWTMCGSATRYTSNAP